MMSENEPNRELINIVADIQNMQKRIAALETKVSENHYEKKENVTEEINSGANNKHEQTTGTNSNDNVNTNSSANTKTEGTKTEGALATGIEVERYLKRKTDGKADSDVPPLQVAEVSGTGYPNRLICPELRGITLKDHPDGPIQTFDAYICHNTDTDYPFVQEILDEMETKYQLHFCTDWRDLVPGGSYATITAELIENRCKRMIVILSPEFLQSEHCDFHTKFALALSPGARSKRMVLVMYKPCDPPSILRHITVCDYTKDALRPYFWPRLYAALNLN